MPAGKFKCSECVSDMKKNDQVFVYNWWNDGNSRQFDCFPGVVRSFSYKKDKGGGISRFCSVQLSDSVSKVQDVFVIPKDRHSPGRVFEEGSKVHAPYFSKKRGGEPPFNPGTVVSSTKTADTTQVKYSVQFDGGWGRRVIEGRYLIPRTDPSDDTTSAIEMSEPSAEEINQVSEPSAEDINQESEPSRVEEVHQSSDEESLQRKNTTKSVARGSAPASSNHEKSSEKAPSAAASQEKPAASIEVPVGDGDDHDAFSQPTLPFVRIDGDADDNNAPSNLFALQMELRRSQADNKRQADEIHRQADEIKRLKSALQALLTG